MAEEHIEADFKFRRHGTLDQREADRVKRILSCRTKRKQSETPVMSSSTAPAVGVRTVGGATGAPSSSPFTLKAVVNATYKYGPKCLDILVTMHMTLMPIVWKIHKFYVKCVSILPTDIFIFIYGMAMCLFGGTFAATIAAIEAFRLSGWETFLEHVCIIMEDLDKLRLANEVDDAEDADGDGIADVNQISKRQLVKRKVALILCSINPERLSSAMGGIYMGFVGVLAALKLHFALVVVMGITIGNELRKPVAIYVAPVLAAVMPLEYHKWISTILSYVCKTIACAIAWWIQTIITTVQSAIAGGLIASRAGLRLAVRYKWIAEIDEDDTMMDEYCGWTAAAIGVYFQISYGFLLPFPFSIILLPITIIEWILRWMVLE